MKPQSKADKIKQVLMADATTSVEKIAKRFKVAPSYVYNIRKKLRGEYVNEPLTPEEEEALNRIASNEGWTVTTSSDDGTMVAMQTSNALNVQVAGNHYKGKAIQPVEYISANNLNFLEGCIVKRITRWRDKPAKERFEDLEKIKHEVDLLIAMEKKYGKEKL